MLTVRHLLQNKDHLLWTIAAEATVYTALELMAEKNIGALPVVEEGRLVGIFSERDYARKVILKGRSSRDTLVRELMTSQVYYVRPDRTLRDCMWLMTLKRIRHLPVLDKGALTGIITIGDVVKGIIEEQEGTIRDLETYITGGLYPGS